MKYIALLRGVNVGGKTPVKMATLKDCFEQQGFSHVRTYINSGNVIFETAKQSATRLARHIELAIEKEFLVPVRIVVFDEPTYRAMIHNVPKGWGNQPDWRYNLLFLIPPYNSKEAAVDIGEPKPEIEIIKAGEGVIYQALLFSAYGRTTGSRLPSRASYKQMTIRNWNTARKLLSLLDEA